MLGTVLRLGARLARARLIGRHASALDHLGHDAPQGFGRDRLGEEIDRAQLHGRDRLGDAAVGRQDDDRDDAPVVPQPAEQLHAVHPGHLKVEQDQVEAHLVLSTQLSSASSPSSASITS